MEYGHYIDCLRIKELTTGTIQAYYDFNHVYDGAHSSQMDPGEFVYNQLYSEAQHIGNVLISDVLPGICVGQTNLPIHGVEVDNEVVRGYFSGVDIIRVGVTLPFSDWTAIMDMNPFLCDYSDSPNLSRVLLSTMESFDSTSGFHVGINQANRPYIHYNLNNQPVYRTLNKEIYAHSLVAIAKGEDDISVNVYDVATDSLSSGKEHHFSTHLDRLSNARKRTDINALISEIICIS